MALTELGTQVIKKLQDCLQRDEPEFTDVDVKELASYMKLSIETVRGALSHLYEEGFAFSYDPGMVGIFVGLTSKGWDVR
jgi:Mn-dependent DtxR family transcriptional regulator